MIHKKWFKTTILGILIVVLIAAIAYPWWLLREDRAEKKADSLQTATSQFFTQYGSDVDVIKTSMLKEVLATQWADGANMHLSLHLNDVWVEVIRQPLTSDNSTIPSP